jgi:E3 ubiquitin-protein ligase MARCH6
VITVWLGALPYIIRQVWRLLFWFSDGGWPAGAVLQLEKNLTSDGLLRELQLASLIKNGTSPVSPLQAAQTTPASAAGVVDIIIGLLSPITQTLNISSADPLAAGLFKSLAYGLGIQTTNVGANDARQLGHVARASRYSSLLSEVSFLRNLTRHPALNQLIINITEGYIITILVVVCFILVFLIREWVVQQQPGINMGAGFNAEFAAGAQDRPRELQIPPAAQGEPHVLPGIENFQENRDAGRRPMARARRRNQRVGQAERGHELQDDPMWEDVDVIPGGLAAPPNRPAPVRDALSPPAEIQRVLTEEPRMTEEFLAIWRRADSDPKEVLRIIERENKGDQMRYWVNAMRMLQNPLPEETPEPRVLSPVEQVAQTMFNNSESSSHDSTETPSTGDQSSSNSEGWLDITSSPPTRTLHPSHPHFRRFRVDERETNSLDKGKSKAEDEDQDSSTGSTDSKTSESYWSPFDHRSGSNRPRSISDGPPIRDAISPLARGNWSFSNLASGEEDAYNAGTSDPSTLRSGTPEAVDIAEHMQQVNANLSTDGSSGASDVVRHPSSIDSIPDYPRATAYAPGEVGEDGPVEIIGLDGVTRTHQNWDEVFENNPVRGLQSDTEEEPDQEPNPFHPDVPPPEARQPIAHRPAEAQGLFGTLADFLWGGIGDDRNQDEPGPNEEHIVQDLAAEAPFVPVAHQDPFQPGENFAVNQEVVEAALAAGLDPNDPDAIDDAEDFEGIMELVGMRGPIFSLVQNALFSAFLLALTVAFGVWIPYNIGRVSLLLMANPGPAFKLPLRLIFGSAAFMQDLALSAAGIVSYCLLAIFCAPLNIWSYFSSGSQSNIVRGSTELASMALSISHSSLDRIIGGTLSCLVDITDSDIFAFSAASHESLIVLQDLIINTLITIGSSFTYIFTGDYTVSLPAILRMVLSISTHGWQLLLALPEFLARPDSWVISLEVGKRAVPLDLELSVWGPWDRFWAVSTGYAVVCLLGALYVKKGTPFSSNQVGREWEATIIDLLNQAGGVLKVILIISIEMLVFPLYCGLLLDAALLPLFDHTTIMSRILFTFKSPLTSIFVHWFVGTCYMFHFALFVSMCRKIMRKGVLCRLLSVYILREIRLMILDFIRDPDDPTFHPVRDVLERNVATQLRKILFSALVYGGLVVICLGGVVWGLAYAFKGVLPIHWSSNEPVLEFPIDLLFYNFLMPLAVKFFKPSDGLHAMYTWWFRQCARMLRLTWFMFDERKLDEEGFNVRRNWGDAFRRVSGDPGNKIKPEKIDQPFIDDPNLRVYFHSDGRYVRAPASDQVRIPKGTRIFLEVDEDNHRIDKKRDRTDGVHGSNNDHYKHVYIPPWFRMRIFLFILSIWMFAAITGVSITIVPLVFGRHIFGILIPPHVRKNDVYAFSIGIYILGSALYAVLHLGKFFSYLRTALAIDAETPYNVFRRATAVTSRILRVAYTWAAFIFLLPTLFAFVIEMYFITPLHTYFSVEEPHVIHFVQSWTLGLLYVKLTTRIILWHGDSRPAQSLRAITQKGYLNPDAWLATRSFIIPATILLTMALCWPWVFARLAVTTILKTNPEIHLLAYRYAYPITLCLVSSIFALYVLFGWLKDWRMKIRDEVYLIGERLHNFGDRKSVSGGVAVPNMRRLEA